MPADSLPPETDTAAEPVERDESWVFLLFGLMSVGYLVLAVVDVEQPLPQGPAWTTASVALLAGACSCVVRSLTKRSLLMLAVAMVGAGLLTHAWGEEDLSHVWFASAALGGSVATVMLWIRRRNPG